MLIVKIQKLDGEQLAYFKALLDVFERAFEIKAFARPQDSYLQTLLKQEGFLVFVAVAEGLVVGGLTAYVINQYYATAPLAYVYDLAVEPAYQRRGTGSQLMRAVIQFCKENGMEEVFVQADAGDEHAVQFYKATGGIAEDVVHFNYPCL